MPGKIPGANPSACPKCGDSPCECGSVNETDFQPREPFKMVKPIQWVVIPCPHCHGAPQRADAIKVPTQAANGDTIDLCALCGGHGLVKRRYDMNDLEELA